MPRRASCASPHRASAHHRGVLRHRTRRITQCSLRVHDDCDFIAHFRGRMRQRMLHRRTRACTRSDSLGLPSSAACTCLRLRTRAHRTGVSSHRTRNIRSTNTKSHPSRTRERAVRCVIGGRPHNDRAREHWTVPRRRIATRRHTSDSRMSGTCGRERRGLWHST